MLCNIMVMSLAFIQVRPWGVLYVLQLSRSSNGDFKPLLDPGGGFTSETAARRSQKQNGRYVTASEVKR
jgi:hypothetical protein